MKVILGCEESQIVCIAFRERGHEAYSCDLKPCSGGHPEWHIQEDIIRVMQSKQWDMGIFFPPCTDLAVSGARYFEQKRNDGRQQRSIDFFLKFTKLSYPSGIENPVGIMSTIYRKPDQIIQPWQFGDPFTKTTCLWLKNLPPLIPTQIVSKGERHITKSGKSLPGWYNLPPSPERGKIRSKTFPGFAKAMAEQWG